MSTVVFPQDLADYSWGFVEVENQRTRPSAAVLTFDRHLQYVHAEIANEADDFATAFFPLNSRLMKVNDFKQNIGAYMKTLLGNFTTHRDPGESLRYQSLSGWTSRVCLSS